MVHLLQQTAILLYPGRIDKNEIQNIHQKERLRTLVETNKRHLKAKYENYFKKLCELYELNHDCSTTLIMDSNDCEEEEFFINIKFSEKGYPKCVSALEDYNHSALERSLQENLIKDVAPKIASMLKGYKIYSVEQSLNSGYVLFYDKKPMYQGRPYRVELIPQIYNEISKLKNQTEIESTILCISRFGNDFKGKCIR